MKIVLAHCCDNGYCSYADKEVFFFDDAMTEAEINQEIWTWAYEIAYVYFGTNDCIENYVNYDWHEATYEEYVEWCKNWGYKPKALN